MYSYNRRLVQEPPDRKTARTPGSAEHGDSIAHWRHGRKLVAGADRLNSQVDEPRPWRTEHLRRLALRRRKTVKGEHAGNTRGFAKHSKIDM
ncbi:MAG TPA: hypothetical protein VFI31_26220 [Pirellulales bacterium]|nr:hypothetical protein [Pirellulales bacterium]